MMSYLLANTSHSPLSYPLTDNVSPLSSTSNHSNNSSNTISNANCNSQTPCTPENGINPFTSTHSSSSKKAPSNSSSSKSKRREKLDRSIKSPNFDPIFCHPNEIKHRRKTEKLQYQKLEAAFIINPKPNPSARKALSERLGMTERRVQVWFQNRRAKERNMEKKQRECLKEGWFDGLALSSLSHLNSCSPLDDSQRETVQEADYNWSSPPPYVPTSQNIYSQSPYTSVSRARGTAKPRTLFEDDTSVLDSEVSKTLQYSPFPAMPPYSTEFNLPSALEGSQHSPYFTPPSTALLHSTELITPLPSKPTSPSTFNDSYPWHLPNSQFPFTVTPPTVTGWNFSNSSQGEPGLNPSTALADKKDSATKKPTKKPGKKKPKQKPKLSPIKITPNPYPSQYGLGKDGASLKMSQKNEEYNIAAVGCYSAMELDSINYNDYFSPSIKKDWELATPVSSNPQQDSRNKGCDNREYAHSRLRGTDDAGFVGMKKEQLLSSFLSGYTNTSDGSFNPASTDHPVYCPMSAPPIFEYSNYFEALFGVPGNKVK